MSNQEVKTEGAPARREQIRISVERLRQTRQRSMLGLPELIGLASSALLLLIVFFAYFYSLAPARTRLESLNDERNRLQKQLRTAQEGVNTKESTQATVEKINASLQEFEEMRLSGRGEGRMNLYTEINQLIRRNAVRNTSGPTYVALEALGNATQRGGGAAQSSQKTGNARWQSIFPGIGVSLTVEGQYQNIRHFIRDIELSRQFIVVNAIELESLKETGPVDLGPAPTVNEEGAPAAPASRPATQTARGALVSLRMDLAVYFRRETSGATSNEASPAASTATQ
ncbi:MAG TPA: GspMb/PilO family protein [Pyrinomonadaceae bacterium]|jgi:Tfp pilus assembly protein PilO